MQFSLNCVYFYYLYLQIVFLIFTVLQKAYRMNFIKLEKLLSRLTGETQSNLKTCNLIWLRFLGIYFIILHAIVLCSYVYGFISNSLHESQYRHLVNRTCKSIILK